MNTRFIRTEDGRELKVEGGTDRISIANMISNSPNPTHGAGMDEEEPLPMPSLNAAFGQQDKRRDGPYEYMEEGPLPVPSMSFAPPAKADNERRRRGKDRFVTQNDKGAGEALPVPRMKF